VCECACVTVFVVERASEEVGGPKGEDRRKVEDAQRTGWFASAAPVNCVSSSYCRIEEARYGTMVISR
jgi:hypothetical protein